MELETKQEILEQNIDSTMVNREGTYRKPRGIAGYEYSYIWPVEQTFGASLYQSILKAFAAVFEYEGLPEEIDAAVFETFLNQSGRMKMIKVGSKFYFVHVAPKMFDKDGNWISSTIIEPYMPALTGKEAENFKNVQFKNDVLGQSLIRLVHPYIEAIDDVMFNLDINQKVLAGKYVLVKDEVSNDAANQEEAEAASKWLIDGQPIKAIKSSMLTNAGDLPFKALESYDATQSYIATIQLLMNQMLNVLGIPNNNAEGKKERMIVSEIAIQNVLQSSILDDMLKSRTKAIEECNEVFGWNASVKIREDIQVGGLEATNTAVENERGVTDVK